MRTKAHIKLAFTLAAIFLLASACNIPTGATPDAQAPTNTDPPVVDAQPTDTTAPEPTAENTPETPADTLAPTETLAHVSYPTQGGSTVYMTDPSTKTYGPEGRSVADAFVNNIMERPLTAQDMDYKPYLDIIRADLSITSPFVYVTIRLEGSAPQDSPANYGFEIDADKDGRGDWLIYGQVPDGTEWTTVGVRVYEDTNNDVGGPTPIFDDGALPNLDGYETMLFNQGYETTDPDMAWIRRDPNNDNRVQLAVKYNAIGSADQFLWGAWSDEGPVEPGWFDYNDHFTEVEAGSPLSNNPNYPLDQLPLVDNTCRWVYGFTPTGNEPGICVIPEPTPTPTLTPTPPLYNISGIVFYDNNFDGSYDGGEGPLSGMTVTLGNGACNSSGLASVATSSTGAYSFTNLPAGTYCVTVEINLTNCGWHTMTGKQTTIILDGNKGYNFGFVQIPC